ncbi:putative Bet v I/Major latex protein [Helianthus annuus]|uniref:Bet v I/Major latex protein n=1 Tax=Helianthus annuus TaxID=4232 RepID=A0A251VMU7_HELAN|nr:root allergen protein [Helianthus annuus]KAF5820519.1 putative Bet v I/Major latex protein [Helianthus annuus]KAJ0610337.1 putative Bet v I/Major latex protein [Helianthus annuus]KAJ0791193.1 putative Bet v I/Major latex protein [Helianthus annuus]
MDAVYAEVEITSSLSAPKLFKVYTDFDIIAPKINPESYKTINVIKGDGGVGSIKSMTYNDGTSSKHTVDDIDTSNFILSWTFFEGDALMGIINTTTYHMKFIPSPNGGSVFKQTFLIRYKGDAKQMDDVIKIIKESITNTFKKMESYAIAHPEVY